MSAADLRVVILSYGTGGQYLRLVEELAGEGIAKDRILVVHNPSTPGERPPGDGAGCELLVADHNLGYAKGMNLGIRRQLERDPDLLLLLTHDAGLRPGALALMLAAAAENPDFAVLGPVLMLTGTDTPYSFGGIRRRDGSVGHRPRLPPGAAGIAACDWVDGGTMLLRAEAVRRVGTLDEGLWGYTEEAELCLRIARAGFRVGIVVGAVADQDPGGPKRPGPWAYLLTRNGLAYAQKSVGPRGVAFIAGRAVLVALYELTRAAARATGLREGSPAAQWAVARGLLLGIIDYFRGRWGAPPASLPGAGDVSNLAPVDADDGD
jgi:N-acetylglucosaminyl-diphospho-decaprenol L-rhamnosyltransferase